MKGQGAKPLPLSTARLERGRVVLFNVPTVLWVCSELDAVIYGRLNGLQARFPNISVCCLAQTVSADVPQAQADRSGCSVVIDEKDRLGVRYEQRVGRVRPFLAFVKAGSGEATIANSSSADIRAEEMSKNIAQICCGDGDWVEWLRLHNRAKRVQASGSVDPAITAAPNVPPHPIRTTPPPQRQRQPHVIPSDHDTNEQPAVLNLDLPAEPENWRFPRNDPAASFLWQSPRPSARLCSRICNKEPTADIRRWLKREALKGIQMASSELGPLPPAVYALRHGEQYFGEVMDVLLEHGANVDVIVDNVSLLRFVLRQSRTLEKCGINSAETVRQLIAFGASVLAPDGNPLYSECASVSQRYWVMRGTQKEPVPRNVNEDLALLGLGGLHRLDACVVGQRVATSALRRSVINWATHQRREEEQQRRPLVLLFCGPPHHGKSTLAKILAQCLMLTADAENLVLDTEVESNAGKQQLYDFMQRDSENVRKIAILTDASSLLRGDRMFKKAMEHGTWSKTPCSSTIFLLSGCSDADKLVMAHTRNGLHYDDTFMMHVAADEVARIAAQLEDHVLRSLKPLRYDPIVVANSKIVPFLPFNRGETAVLCDDDLRWYTRTLMQPVTLQRPVADICLTVNPDACLTARTFYDPDLGLPSLKSRCHLKLNDIITRDWHQGKLACGSSVWAEVLQDPYRFALYHEQPAKRWRDLTLRDLGFHVDGEVHDEPEDGAGSVMDESSSSISDNEELEDPRNLLAPAAKRPRELP